MLKAVSHEPKMVVYRKPRIWKHKSGWVIEWNRSTHSGIPSFEQAVEQWFRYLIAFAQYYPKDWWLDFA